MKEVKIIILTETKLTKRFKLEGWKHSQTKWARNGGCQAATNFPHNKHIKSLRTNINWFAVTLDRVPVHFITCYLQPWDQRHTRKTLRRLLHIIDEVNERISSSRFIFAGDFNELREETEQLLIQRGLQTLLPTGATTHRAGGQLDQIFSNMRGLANTILVDFSDQVGVHVKFYI